MTRNERLVEIVKWAILRRLDAGVIDWTPLTDAWAEDVARNAVQAMQGVLGACPRCSAPLPQYEGLCATCAKTEDHEEES